MNPNLPGWAPCTLRGEAGAVQHCSQFCHRIQLVLCSLAEASAFSSRPDPGQPGPDQRERAPDGRHADGEGRQCQLGGGLQSPDNHTPPHGARSRGEHRHLAPPWTWISCVVVARGSENLTQLIMMEHQGSGYLLVTAVVPLLI